MLGNAFGLASLILATMAAMYVICAVIYIAARFLLPAALVLIGVAMFWPLIPLWLWLKWKYPVPVPFELNQTRVAKCVNAGIVVAVVLLILSPIILKVVSGH
jgi:hypothetical protein